MHSPSRSEDNFATDKAIGMRVRIGRVEIGISQTALAAGIGISFQAVQKYERGEIRISASRLVDIGKVLNRPPEWFFEDIERSPPIPETEGRRLQLEIGRAAMAITDHPAARALLNLMRSLAPQE